jgi:hypothetical protein
MPAAVNGSPDHASITNRPAAIWINESNAVQAGIGNAVERRWRGLGMAAGHQH